MSSVEMIVTQATPAFIGYARSSGVDPLYYLRPSSLKGVWRWVLRSLIAGAMYRAGLLCGVPGRSAGVSDVYRVPSEAEARTIAYIVGNVLGMGYVGPGEVSSVSSAYRLNVRVIRRPRVRTASGGRIGRYAGDRLQRVVLQTLGGRRVDFFEGGRFVLRIIVRRNLDNERTELVIRSLVLALTIMGLGKGSRRGLGSFDVEDIRGSIMSRINIDERDFTTFVENTTRRVSELLTDIQRTLPESIPRPRGSSCGDEQLPPLPAITDRKIGEFPVSQVYRFESIDWRDVHNFFVRTERCRRLRSSSSCRDALRENFSAWILGLPRGRGRSGYSILSPNRSLSRRASPILLSYHTKNHILGQGSYVTFLASADWPKVIVWEGSTRIEINDDRIIQAMSIARQELLDYVGESDSRPVWPQLG